MGKFINIIFIILLILSICWITTHTYIAYKQITNLSSIETRDLVFTNRVTIFLLFFLVMSSHLIDCLKSFIKNSKKEVDE